MAISSRAERGDSQGIGDITAPVRGTVASARGHAYKTATRNSLRNAKGVDCFRNRPDYQPTLVRKNGHPEREARTQKL